MTAASGDPGERPDYQGHPPSGSGIPPVDPAYGGWQPAPGGPPPADYPYPYIPPLSGSVPGPAPGYGTGYPPPPAATPGYPPYPGGYGDPGFPSYPGYRFAAQRRTNVLAIVSLVGSISGVLCFIGSLVGIITGVIAINQIKRTGEKGWGLAVAGAAAGIAGLLLYIVMVAAALR